MDHSYLSASAQRVSHPCGTAPGESLDGVPVNGGAEELPLFSSRVLGSLPQHAAVGDGAGVDPDPLSLALPTEQKWMESRDKAVRTGRSSGILP